MSEFHDPELRQQLGRLSGPYPDDNAAFAAWQRRVVQARRRRAVAWATGAAMSLIVGTVAVAAIQNPTRHSLVPSKSTESSAEPTVSVLETEADESSTVETTAADTTAPATDAPDTTAITVAETETSLPDDQAIAGEQPPAGTSKGHGGSTTPPPPSTQLTTQTFAATGGSITVRIEGDELVVVSTNPAAGFQARDTKDSGKKVDVTFKSERHQSHISVKLTDGVMKPNVNEKSEADDGTVPDESADGDGNDHGGGDNND